MANGFFSKSSHIKEALDKFGVPWPSRKGSKRFFNSNLSRFHFTKANTSNSCAPEMILNLTTYHCSENVARNSLLEC